MKKYPSMCAALLLVLFVPAGAFAQTPSLPPPTATEPGLAAQAGVSSWRDAFGEGIDGLVQAIAVDGENVYVGGSFSSADGLPASNIAVWNGSHWSALGAGVNGPVHSIAVFQGQVYAGGRFTQAGGGSATNIARWNGASWSEPGGGVDGPVYAIATFGGALVVGGDFGSAGLVSAANIARWNGSAWLPLGDGMDCAVYALAGDEQFLYAGGAFTRTGVTPARYAARWNGYSWSGLGDGMDGPVTSLAVRGSVATGGYLFAGGYFTEAGGVPAGHLARWNGSYWWGVGGGVDRIVRALATTDSVLYVGGWFRDAGGAPVSFVARNQGSAWIDLEGGLDAPVAALAAAGGRLFAGGEFDSAGAVRSARIALWDPDSSTVYEPPYKVRIRLKVSNAGGSRDLFFGVRAGAARGIWGVDPAAGAIDSLEGEEELPPALAGIFDARFAFPAGDYEIFGGGSWADIRNFHQNTQVDTYRVVFQPGSFGYPVTVRWQADQVAEAYAGAVTLRAIGGFSYDMKSADSVSIGDDFINQLIITADEPALPVLYTAGWNLISVPNDVPDGAKEILYPDAPGSAFRFAYALGYQPSAVLSPGVGYWLKFPSVVHSLTFDGPERLSDSVDVQEGWNLIGGLNVPVPVATVTSDPPGMITGNFFGYDAGFKAATVLEPMRGYWIKTSQTGKLHFAGTGSAKAAAAIRIVPDGDLPPPPPDATTQDDPPVVSEFRLRGAYPNPFNPATTIEFEVPDESRVTLTVYNVFGQVVGVLADGVVDRGVHAVAWDASALASGVYFCRFEAAGTGPDPKSFVRTTKLVLMK